jgi:hypothetical protein
MHYGTGGMTANSALSGLFRPDQSFALRVRPRPHGRAPLNHTATSTVCYARLVFP